MRDWEGKSIYIEIYRDIDIYTGTSRPRAAAGAATAVAGRHSQHLNTCISFADALKNWRDFFSRKNKTKHHDRPPYLVPNPQPTPPSPLSDKSEPDHGDCRSTHTCPGAARPSGGGDKIAHAKNKARSQASSERKESPPPPQGGGQEHWGVIFWEWALGHEPAFLSSAPLSPLVIFCLGSPAPLRPSPHPTRPAGSWSCRGPQMTINDSHSEEKKEREREQAREAAGAGEADTVHRPR